GQRHVIRVIGPEDDVIAAIEAGEIIELMVREHDRVEIELLQIVTRRALNHLAAVGSCAMDMVVAAAIGRRITAAMRETYLQLRIVLEHAAEDHMTDSHGGIERIADDVDEIMLSETLAMGEAGGMHENENVELLRLGEERPEARIG